MSLVHAAIAFRQDPTEDHKQALLQEVVYALHSDIVKFAARFHYFPDQSEFDDVIQAVWTRLFLKVIRLAATGRMDVSRSEASARAYLRQIMKHDMLDIMREHSKAKPIVADEEKIDSLAEITGDGVDQAPSAEELDDQQIVVAAMHGLAAEDQAIIKLRIFAGLGYREIAQQLGITVGAARVRYHRALIRLRDALK
jgi:RNA polymerase sigma factor (sigma-70 family)